jgi:hypothetical protein
LTISITLLIASFLLTYDSLFAYDLDFIQTNSDRLVLNSK